MDALVEIARELCAAPPAAFTELRDRRAREQSDPQVAAAVKTMRKPVLAAWVANALAREAADELGEALSLAIELRAAADGLDAPALAVLNRERRALARALAQRAVDIADAHGVAVGAAVRDAVEQTVNAAMRDPAAAAALASARLIRPLEASGLDPVEVSGAVAGPLEVPPAAAPAPTDELAERRTRKEAERAARETERAAERAEGDQARAQARWQGASDRARQLEARVAQLEADLARARAEAHQAQEEADRLDARRSEAAAARTSAARQAQRARARLAELTGLS